ncbi:MAG: 16S rRNA (uracil(1498)-N(3))-methyltransferase [Candidatus Aminicenantes bacterium]|nr:MAG: 16S rRNA (uracil(1498)-N(3))-methyltransferase [Candidatus Aminicenantes bacterium]
MTTHRFYIKGKPQESASIFLEGEEHHHLSKVARIKSGEHVWVFDDSGNQYKACVEEIGKSRTRLIILETEQKQRPKVRITLAQVLLKTKNMDLVIQKATELGTHSLVPVISDRTIAKIEGKQDKKIERWKRIAIEASKQCGRSTVPEILLPVSLKTFIHKKENAKKLFLSERGGESLREILMYPLTEKIQIPESIILLVGPEGGWTENEEQDIMDSNYDAVSLGSLTLRSETAAIISLAMVSHFWKIENVS